MSTRADLIAAAQELFAQRGFEKTSVRAIVEAAGVSKGAFYHHFESKMGLLNALVEDFVIQQMEKVRPIVDDETIWSLDKLNGFIAEERRTQNQHLKMAVEMTALIHKGDNVVVHQKIDMRMVSRSAPLLAEIIRQGVQEEQFSVSDPEETATLLLHMGQEMGHILLQHYFEDEMTEENIDSQKRRSDSFFEAFERILGAPEGSLIRAHREHISELFESIHRYKTDV